MMMIHLPVLQLLQSFQSLPKRGHPSAPRRPSLLQLKLGGREHEPKPVPWHCIGTELSGRITTVSWTTISSKPLQEVFPVIPVDGLHRAVPPLTSCMLHSSALEYLPPGLFSTYSLKLMNDNPKVLSPVNSVSPASRTSCSPYQDIRIVNGETAALLK